MSDEEQNYMAALQLLWDMLSDCVEGGRLTEVDIPDDYHALVEQMVKCEYHNDSVKRAHPGEY